MTLRKAKHVYTEVRKNWRDKYWWSNRIMQYLVQRYYQKFPKKGPFIMDIDWDNLIILDACRYDTFCEVAGNSSYIISMGSSTGEFLEENFAGHKFTNTVYVTANPNVARYGKSFHKVIPVYKHEWNEEMGTVLPQAVVDFSLNTEDEYPDKRLIIHFVQPHWPYIKDPEINQYGRRICERDLPYTILVEAVKHMGLERVYEAYKRNLEVVLPYAFELVEKLRGKTVITSDHGEAFNDWAFPFPIKILGHYSFVHIPALVKIPWLEYNNKERKKIVQDNEKQRIRRAIRKVIK